LAADTEYNFYLAEGQSTSFGDGSNAVKVRTDKAGDEVSGSTSAPSFTVSSNRAEEIFVSVTPLAEGTTGKYKLQYVSANAYGQATFDGHDSSYVIKKLKPNTQYDVYLSVDYDGKQTPTTKRWLSTPAVVGPTDP